MGSRTGFQCTVMYQQLKVLGDSDFELAACRMYLKTENVNHLWSVSQRMSRHSLLSIPVVCIYCVFATHFSLGKLHWWDLGSCLTVMNPFWEVLGSRLMIMNQCWEVLISSWKGHEPVLGGSDFELKGVPYIPLLSNSKLRNWGNSKQIYTESCQ